MVCLFFTFGYDELHFLIFRLDILGSYEAQPCPSGTYSNATVMVNFTF